MAKRIRTSSRPVSAKQTDDVRRVRARYAEALKLGHPKEAAARLANGSGPIVQAEPAAPAPATVERRQQPREASVIHGSETVKTAAPEPTTIAGMAGTEQPQPPVEIPPNWADLPWPDLRKLAQQVSGRVVASRREAQQVLEAYKGT